MQEDLETLLMEGLCSGPPTEMTREDWADLRCEAIELLELRKSRKQD
jgi:hypothetical protein